MSSSRAPPTRETRQRRQATGVVAIAELGSVAISSARFSWWNLAYCVMFGLRIFVFASVCARSWSLHFATFDDASASSVYGGSAADDALRFGPTEALSSGSGYYCSAGIPDEA